MCIRDRAFTALVLSGLLTVVISDTEAAEPAMSTAQSECGSPVSLSPEVLPVRGTPTTSYLETDTQAIMMRALRFQEEGDHDSARRFLVLFFYLNDVEEGGETYFQDIDFTVQPKEGRLLIFPPTWMFPHAGLKPVSNDKYIAGTYLHYT